MFMCPLFSFERRVSGRWAPLLLPRRLPVSQEPDRGRRNQRGNSGTNLRSKSPFMHVFRVWRRIEQISHLLVNVLKDIYGFFFLPLPTSSTWRTASCPARRRRRQPRRARRPRRRRTKRCPRRRRRSCCWRPRRPTRSRDRFNSVFPVSGDDLVTFSVHIILKLEDSKKEDFMQCL